MVAGAMDARKDVSRLRRCPNRSCLAGLAGVLDSDRKSMELFVLHLAEVEGRRLHLTVGHGSLFAYCTDRLGMSEDEAYRHRGGASRAAIRCVV